MRSSPRRFTIPWAEMRHAWTGPGISCLIVAVHQASGPETPQEILNGLAQARMDDFAVEVLAKEVRTVAGMRAAWLVVKGKGNRGAIDGVGETDTVDHFVVVPHQDNTAVVLLMTCEAGVYDGCQKSLETALATLQLSGSQTNEQSATK